MNRYKIKSALYSIGTVLGIFAIFGATLAGAANAAPSHAASNQSPDLASALLPGDATIGAAAGNQENAQIAAGPGMSLVVWEDSRTNFIGATVDFIPSGGDASGQSLKDVYAARVDAQGNLLDATPIVVGQGSFDQSFPEVAWNGQNWLVVWNGGRVAGTYQTKDIFAARVSPSGVVLDTPAIVVDGSDAVDELWPTVASDGTDWAVAWMDQGSYFELRGARISPEGTVRDPGGVALHQPQFPGAPYNPSIAFAGDEYLVAWSGDNSIKGLRLTPALQPLGGVFTISAGGNGTYANFPDVASNGDQFYVVWEEVRYYQLPDTFGTRIAHNGTVLDPAGDDLSFVDFDVNSGDHASVAWDGTQWYVAWQDGGVIEANRVAADGTVLNPGGVAIGGGTGFNPAVAARPGGTGAHIVFSSYQGSQYDISLRSMAADGATTPGPVVSQGAPSQRQPDFAAGDNGYLAVFLSAVSNETRIKAQRLDANGVAIDAEPVLVQGGSTSLRNPRVAWNGSLYLVVWENASVSQGFVPGAIFGKRVSPEGVVLDASPISIVPGNTPDVAALGDTFLVVSSHEPVNHQRYVKANKVNGDGTVPTSPVQIGSSYALNPKVAALGDRWLAVWAQRPTHDNPRSRAYANFVNPDLTTPGQFFVAGDGISAVKTPHLATGNGQALIVYYTAPSGSVGGDIYGRRILADGTLLDSAPGIQITTAPNPQQFPSVTWDGTEFVVAYEDLRNVPYLDRPISDVYGTRVSDTGAVLDANGFPIGNDRTPEVNPETASLNGSYIIGYADFRDRAPYVAYRIDVVRGQAGSPPTPQATETPGNSTPTTISTAAATSTSIPTAVATTTQQATGTAVAATSTSIPTSTQQPGGTAVATATSTSVAPTATVVVCDVQFVDVPEGSTFYSFVKCLACAGILGGYSDNTFRPNNQVTRGQLAKIVSNAAGYNEPVSGQTFTDVSPTHTFYPFIERMAARGVLGGYSDGTFRPDNNASRGQIAKIVSNAAGFNEPMSGQTFTDVAPGSTFYEFVERLSVRGIIGGYSDGTFRPGNNATRGQTSKIVSSAFFPDCSAR
jgi:hypothetical protein